MATKKTYKMFQNNKKKHSAKTCFTSLSNSFNCIMLVETTHLIQVECNVSFADVRAFTFVLQ